MTLPEVLLWQQLRASKLGVPFRKQHPIGPFKADFCCTERQFVIEVDGSAHDSREVALRDENRNRIMEEKGYLVLRIAARDVLGDMEAVLKQIRAALPPLHRSAVPLPASGEDFA